jgi:hypothetical protein
MVQAMISSSIYYFKSGEGIYVKLSKGKMKKREKEYSVKPVLNVRVRESRKRETD